MHVKFEDHAEMRLALIETVMKPELVEVLGPPAKNCHEGRRVFTSPFPNPWQKYTMFCSQMGAETMLANKYTIEAYLEGQGHFVSKLIHPISHVGGCQNYGPFLGTP